LGIQPYLDHNPGCSLLKALAEKGLEADQSKLYPLLSSHAQTDFPFSCFPAIAI